MLLLALKRVLPRRLPLILALTCAVMTANYFQSGHIEARGVLLIFAIAFCATVLIYLPVEYQNVKQDQQRK